MRTIMVSIMSNKMVTIIMWTRIVTKKKVDNDCNKNVDEDCNDDKSEVS